jgi:late competence protein required for DNA uptake (superfamily II DNA/RNA helicase)
LNHLVAVVLASIHGCVAIVYSYLQARTASETVEQIRSSALVTLEQQVQTLIEAVFGSQGLQIKLEGVEKTLRNGTLSDAVSLITHMITFVCGHNAACESC